jgi:hypothetical protein
MGNRGTSAGCQEPADHLFHEVDDLFRPLALVATQDLPSVNVGHDDQFQDPPFTQRRSKTCQPWVEAAFDPMPVFGAANIQPNFGYPFFVIETGS